MMQLVKIIFVCSVIVYSNADENSLTSGIAIQNRKDRPGQMVLRPKMRPGNQKKNDDESAKTKKSGGPNENKPLTNIAPTEKNKQEIAGRSGGLGSSLELPNLQNFNQNRRETGDKVNMGHSLSRFGQLGQPGSPMSSLLNNPHSMPQPNPLSNPLASPPLGLSSMWSGTQNKQDNFGLPQDFNSGFSQPSLSNQPLTGRNNQENPSFDSPREQKGKETQGCNVGGRLLKAGDKWSESGICGLFTCQGNMFRILTTECPPLRYQEGSFCDVEEQDLARDYPNCCPKLVCSNKNETTPSPVDSVYNSPYSSMLNSFKSSF